MSDPDKQGWGIVGVGALACAACCAGPIIGAVGAVAAIGSGLLLGVGAAVLLASATLGFLVYRRRRAARGGAVEVGPVPVAIPTVRR